MACLDSTAMSSRPVASPWAMRVELVSALVNTFIGVDLGWYGKPSGLASIALEGSGLHLRNIARLESADAILEWIQSEAGSGSAVVAVDAPLVIRNQTGIRPAERELNRDLPPFPCRLPRRQSGPPIRFQRNFFQPPAGGAGFRAWRHPSHNARKAGSKSKCTRTRQRSDYSDSIRS